MFAGITSHAGALVTATVVLAGTAIVGAGTVAADPNQDDQFLALLVEKRSPPAGTCRASSPLPIRFVANSMAACRWTT